MNTNRPCSRAFLVLEAHCLVTLVSTVSRNGHYGDDNNARLVSLFVGKFYNEYAFWQLFGHSFVIFVLRFKIIAYGYVGVCNYFRVLTSAASFTGTDVENLLA